MGLVTVIDAWASESHYLDALAPLWQALGERRGHLYVPTELVAHARALGLEPGGRSERGDVLLAASWRDARTSRQWPTVALMEHGVGQTYKSAHDSYAGGFGRCDFVDLFLCPNQRVAQANRDACPQARIEVVGSPYLDQLALIPREPDVDVGFVWHWDCDLNPETAATYRYWWPAVERLAKTHSVLGHGHPRAMRQLRYRYKGAGIPVAVDFTEMVRRCRVIVGDNTSCLYLAAALGIPVVVLNAPSYRRDVHHGLRFWDCADVGHQCDDPAWLGGVVGVAMGGPASGAARVVGELFPWQGEAVERAVSVLAGHVERDGHGGAGSFVHDEGSMGRVS